jgi:hypothetical protein
MWRIAIGPPQGTARPVEDLLDLDDVPFDATWNRNDLSHLASTMCIGHGVHYQVNRGGNRGHDERVTYVFTGEKRQRAEFGDGLPG